ncbi:MAG TPA: hypothetical protein DD670_04610, partial [Planctomycetaceae bacterium]|nr:hypothetical protein [Planctomycetaceae bacterium]
MNHHRLATLVILAAALGAAGLTPFVSQAEVIIYTASLSGPAEEPPNASPGTGFAQIDYDDVLHTMRLQVTFSDLLGTTTVAHVHAPTADPFAGNVGVAFQTGTFP